MASRLCHPIIIVGDISTAPTASASARSWPSAPSLTRGSRSFSSARSGLPTGGNRLYHPLASSSLVMHVGTKVFVAGIGHRPMVARPTAKDLSVLEITRLCYTRIQRPIEGRHRSGSIESQLHTDCSQSQVVHTGLRRTLRGEQGLNSRMIVPHDRRCSGHAEHWLLHVHHLRIVGLSKKAKKRYTCDPRTVGSVI